MIAATPARRGPTRTKKWAFPFGKAPRLCPRRGHKEQAPDSAPRSRNLGGVLLPVPASRAFLGGGTNQEDACFGLIRIAPVSLVGEGRLDEGSHARPSANPPVPRSVPIDRVEHSVLTSTFLHIPAYNCARMPVCRCLSLQRMAWAYLYNLTLTSSRTFVKRRVVM